MTGNCQVDLRALFVISMDSYIFLEPFSAGTVCINFYSDFSLTAGRDLSRVRDSSTSSVSFDFFNFQRCRTFVLYDKVMCYLNAISNWCKLIGTNRHKGRRKLLSYFFGPGRIGYGKKNAKSKGKCNMDLKFHN